MKEEPQRHFELSRFGEPATLVLLALASGPMHGYTMMVSIEKDLGFKLGPGTLYGAIAKLLKLGLIRALESDNRTKPYEITSEGREALAEFIRQWEPAIRFGQARLA